MQKKKEKTRNIVISRSKQEEVNMKLTFNSPHLVMNCNKKGVIRLSKIKQRTKLSS